MTAPLLAAAALAGCGSSGSSPSGSTTVTASQAVAATTAGESQTTATTRTATASATSEKATSTSEKATSTASSVTSTHSAAPVKPTRREKEAVVALCRASVESQAQVAPATRTTLSRLCGTAVDASTLHDRRKAAEAICLGLVGATAATSEQARKIILKDCKTNAWD